MITWSDISTAPKDGTKIIGFPFFGEPAIAYWRNGAWCVDSSSQDGLDFEGIELTHWSEANKPLGEKVPDVNYAVLGAKKLISDMVGNKQ